MWAAIDSDDSGMTGGNASPEIKSEGSDCSVEDMALGMIDGNYGRVACDVITKRVWSG
jgi:hypothetical protein